MQYYNDPVNLTPEEQRQQINENKMCLESFLLKIRDEISVSCNIPVNIPDKNLLNIIEQCKKWFYDHYEYSVEEYYLAISASAFSSPDYKKYTYLKLPEEVFSVFGVHKLNTSNMLTKYSNIGSGAGNPVNLITNTNVGSDPLMGYIMVEFYDTFRNSMLTNKYVKWSFNELTHNFKIMGEIPKNDIVLQVYKKVPDCALFSNIKFFDYVVGKCYKNIGKVLGFFTFNLPGGVQMNYDQIQSMGQEMIDKLEEEIKATESVNWFFTQ